MLNELKRDFSISSATAGLIALIATFTGPVLIVVEASKAAGLSQNLLSTWIFAVSMGAGVSGLWLSLRHKAPVIGAWSTPGVALLIFALTQYSFREAIGCYLVLALLVTFLAYSGLFTKLMAVFPTHLLSAMIAGVLMNFCMKIFQSLQYAPAVVLPVLIAYVIFRKYKPRYAVALALLTGVAFSFSKWADVDRSVNINLVIPEVTMPIFSSSSLVGMGVPLFLLALTQFATSLHILRQAGFNIPPKEVVGVSGIVSIPLSLLGSSGTNPAAIVGAICASSECHEDPSKRYISGVVCGIGYIFIGIFGASVISLFSLLPEELVTSLAGLALLGTLISSLTSSLESARFREASMITFIVTTSGMSFFDLGSALWGLLFGALFSVVMKQYNLKNNT